MDAADSMSAAAPSANDVIYHLAQSDFDSLCSLLSGLVSVNLFTLLAQLLTLGVLLVVVFVIALRRF